MDSNTTSDDRSKEFNDRGSFSTSAGMVRDVFAAVDTPARQSDSATLSVKGYAYDDEPGSVVVAVRGDVSTTIVLELDDARALADAISNAAAVDDEGFPLGVDE